MGKKATSYLISVITIYVTIGLAVLSIVAWLGQRLDPTEYWLPAIIGLAIAPLLIADFILLVFWAIRLRLWVIAPIIALVVNWSYISAVIQISPGSQKEQPYDIKVATYNVNSFKHGNFRMTVEIVAEYLKHEKVGIVCFQEFATSAKFNLDSIRRTLYFLPYTHISYDNSRSLNQAIFSKYPITESQLIDFEGTDNSAIWVDITIDGRKLRLVNVHFQTTNINQSKREINQLKGGISEEEDKKALYVVRDRLRSNFTKRALQVELVRSAMDNTDTPLIVCGDFNDTPISFTYNKMMQGMEDGFRRCGNGYQYTYKGIGKLLRIDYILYNDQLEGVRNYSENKEWSDHNPVLLELRFRN